MKNLFQKFCETISGAKLRRSGIFVERIPPMKQSPVGAAYLRSNFMSPLRGLGFFIKPQFYKDAAPDGAKSRKVRGYNLTLRKQDAEQIFVQGNS